MIAEAKPALKIEFIDVLDALPLLDPTAAAARLGIQRHTLACYRSSGQGPAYYKFGRCIRYDPHDLECWLGRPSPPEAVRGQAVEGGVHLVQLVDTPVAASLLTITGFCLRSYRQAGAGPLYRRFGRKVYYRVPDLMAWARDQRIAGSLRHPGESANVNGHPVERACEPCL